jgi:ubiquinone/menaquinone biosynthesis C-methylase UbiE
MSREIAIIYTAGVMGRVIEKYAKALGFDILAFYDNNIAMQNEVIDGIKVYSKEELQIFIRDGGTVIIGCKRYEEEIMSQIEMEFGHEVAIIKFDEIERRYWNEIAIPMREKLEDKYEVDYSSQAKIWLENIMTEVEFWIKNYNKSFYYKKAGEFVCERLNRTLHDGDIVMDVGCGVSTLNGSHIENGRTIELIPVDPLAYFYNKINEKFIGEKIDNKVSFGLFEFLSLFYGENYADVILIRNALDHCIDPFKGVLECVSVLKVGGVLSLSHRRAEAVYEGYTGLHKWNVDVNSENDFILWNETNKVNVSQKLGKYADIEVVLHGKERTDEIIWINITKKVNFEIDKFYDRKSDNKMLAKMVDVFMEIFADEEINARFRYLLE